MVEKLHEKQLGALLRVHRKKQGLSIENLADENISTATISNIERGVPGVGRDKIEYLLKKLGLSAEELSRIAEGHDKRFDEIRFRLFSIEMMLDMGDAKRAMHHLEQLRLEDERLLPEYHFVKGKGFYIRGNWKKAEFSLFKTIHHTKQSGREKTNYQAAAYTYLGLCSFKQNDLDQALAHSDAGLEAFIEEGERRHYKYLLLYNKAIYLGRKKYWAAALKIVEEAWKEIDRIEQVFVRLGLYATRAECLYQIGDYEGALRYALEGLEKARLNSHPYHAFNLWDTLGNVYLRKGDLDQALHCYNMGLNVKDRIDKQDTFSYTYTNLAKLHLQRREWDQAYEYARQAIEMAERYDDAAQLVSSHSVMGDYWRLQDRNEEATACYQRALELARRHKLENQEYETLFRLACCLENVDQEKFLTCLKEMYIIKRERSDPFEYSGRRTGLHDDSLESWRSCSWGRMMVCQEGDMQ